MQARMQTDRNIGKDEGRGMGRQAEMQEFRQARMHAIKDIGRNEDKDARRDRSCHPSSTVPPGP